MNRLHIFQHTKIKDRKHGKAENNISWTKGTIKSKSITCVQVDGAWKKDKDHSTWEAAIAWVEEGNNPTFEAHKVLSSSPIQTEAKALYECLKFWSDKTNAISIKVDCRDLVKDLISGKGENIEISNIVSEIKKIADNFDFISCNYVSRNEVTNAHNLATKARKGK